VNLLWEGVVQAFRLIAKGDPDVFHAVWVSLHVSVAAILLAAAFGVPVGFIVATRSFRGKRAVVACLNTLMSLPSVLAGLLLYSLLSRRGVLGPIGLLYTTSAMMIGQWILSAPTVTALAVAAVNAVDPAVAKTAQALGANRIQKAVAVLREARFALLAAVATAFGRIVGEVGCALMVGGNIRGATRTITTAIALETSKGEFGQAIALGLILLVLSLGINAFIQYLQGKGRA
jgi:tungstate transport system permease protein